MEKDGIVRRRQLPHIDVEGKPYFVTACLKGSLPTFAFNKLQAYKSTLHRRPKPIDLSYPEWESRKQKWIFQFFDRLLDESSGVRHLANPQIAQIVEEAFFHFESERYRIFAYVIMPTHYHWLFLPMPEWSMQLRSQQRESGRHRTPREAIMHSIQSFTSKQCSKLLEKKGGFWQQETYDHFVRDHGELRRIVQYIERNPVKAGLVNSPEDWPWSSARIRQRHEIPIGDWVTAEHYRS